MDVTDEEAVKHAYLETARVYGGVDVIVNNAGLATSSPFDETTLKEWNMNINVLGTGYFLVAREAFKMMKVQAFGGSMVFVGSKNSVYAGKNVTAYSSVKALEAHLARCIAAEGGEYGIRVNTILPDAILQARRSGILIGETNVRLRTVSNRISLRSTTVSALRCW
ncbi:predicted rhamnulose-1-phosphate aldolase [Paenibacillus sp. JCM 10914]|nr:predicted rhamnulose-1-phosphate aldolase [Paenibacillus sp. JCM 10914]